MTALKRWRLGAALLLAAGACTAHAKTELLKHDDGAQDGKLSMTGEGHAVRFECPDDGKWRVTGIRLHGSRYGTAQAPNEDFKIVIASEDFQELVEIDKPYSLFKRGNEKWVRVGFDPVEVQGAFQVAVFFNPTRTKGVYVGIDEDSSPSHSSIVKVSDPAKEPRELEGDWMIRAYVTDKLDGASQRLLSESDRMKARDDEEAARDAELLGDARSITLKHDDGPTDDYINIREAFYTVRFETPQDVEAYVWQVQMYASEFGGRHNSEEVSGDVYILDKSRRILSRTTFPYSVASQERQWVAIPTLPTKVEGTFYVSIRTHGAKTKGLYVGYQEEAGQDAASADERKGDRIAPGDWSNKFSDMQWLIRAKVADRPVVY